MFQGVETEACSAIGGKIQITIQQLKRPHKKMSSEFDVQSGAFQSNRRVGVLSFLFTESQELRMSHLYGIVSPRKKVFPGSFEAPSERLYRALNEKLVILKKHKDPDILFDKKTVSLK
jgi:hypothetical protein